MITNNYPEVFKPLSALLTESVTMAVQARTQASHHLAIIVGADRGAVRDLSLGLIRELYPDLSSTGLWCITDQPSEIPIGPDSTTEATEDWYFGGGHGVFSPQELPPTAATNAEPLQRLLLEAGRRDLDALCILSPLTSTSVWDRALNLYLTGTSVVIGIERNAHTVVEIPHIPDSDSLLPLLFTEKMHPLLLDADAGVIIDDIHTIITLSAK